jgi:tetratricopeptide (TPR) repeat protein
MINARGGDRIDPALSCLAPTDGPSVAGDMPSGVENGPRGGRTLLVVALLAAAYFGYSPALDGELQFDDLHTILGNPLIKHLEHFAGLRFVLGGGERALTTLTFALSYRASGLAVRPYHLVNLALHLGTVLAVLALGFEILRRVRWPAPFATAFIAAALFGLHPIQSQAVAYICQRAEVLAALFYVVALLLAFRAEARGSAALHAGALVCVALGWLAKPTLASFPAALLLCWAAFPSPRGGAVSRVLASLPFLALSGLFTSRLLSAVGGSGHGGFTLQTMTAGRYLLTQSRVILTYLRLIVWPAGQNADWDFPPSMSPLEPRTLFALVAIAAMLLGAAWLWFWSARARDEELRSLARLSSFGVFFFFIVLAPTSSIVPVADVIEEHRVYLASWGIFFPAAAAGVLALRRLAPEKWGALGGVTVALAACAALTVALHRRAAVWESGVSLWSDAVSKSPGKPRPHMNLGYALAPNDPQAALAQFREALRLNDGTVRRDELMQNMAGVLLRLRQYDEALAILQQLRASAQKTPELDTNIAIALLESGRLDEARVAAERAAAQWPLHAPAWHTLGQLAFIRGDYRAAQVDFDRALALDPDSAASLTSLAAAQERLGDRAGACRSWARYARSDAPQAAENALAKLAAFHCEVR